MTWREFLKQHMTGKKFASRSEANAYFKQLSIEYKKMKSQI